MEFNIDTIQEFIEQLCREHKQVAHDVGGVRSFVSYESDDQLNEIRKKAGKNIVVVVEVGGHRSGHADDQQRREVLVLRFACLADAGRNRKQSIKAAQDIMFDFLTRMERQKAEDHDNDVCGPMQHLQPHKAAWERIEDEPWLLNHFGWDLAIAFGPTMPPYKPQNWM